MKFLVQLVGSKLIMFNDFIGPHGGVGHIYLSCEYFPLFHTNKCFTTNIERKQDRLGEHIAKHSYYESSSKYLSGANILS
jgi:hypothetical protein